MNRENIAKVIKLTARYVIFEPSTNYHYDRITPDMAIDALRRLMEMDESLLTHNTELFPLDWK